MRPVVIIVVVAALAAGGTAMLAKSWLDRQAARQAKGDGPAVTEVLVIARDVPAGSALSADDLRYEAWPKSAAAEKLVARRQGEDAKAAFVGTIARRSLVEGEPLSPATTFRAEGGGVLAGLLTPGRRAMSIAVTSPTGVSGFVSPGDRVDVVLVTDLRKVEEGQQSSGGEGASNLMVRFGAETVLSDVRVLAIDQQISRNRDGSAIQGKTATLEVTPKQAEILTVAGQLGALQLSLRPQQGDGETVPAAGGDVLDFTADLEAGKVLQAAIGFKARPAERAPAQPSGIRVNRAGRVSSEGVGR